MALSYYRDRVIWLTGASTGIGAACAREFIREGAKVALSARSERKLAALVSEFGADRAMAVPLDVTSLEANRQAVRTVVEHFGRIDTVFLNAGTWEPMDLDHFDGARCAEIVQTNLVGLAYGIDASLAELRRSPRGHLVGMASSVAYRGIPRAEAYCASKAGARAFLQGLRCQLLPHRIPVSIVLPGFVKSPLTEKNDFDMPFLLEADDAARRIARGIASQRSEIAFPGPFIAMMRLLSWLPDSVYTAIMARKAVKA